MGYSKEEQQSVDGEDGLSFTENGAGNVFGRLEGKNNELPTIVSGSL
ncbi:M20 family metallo-hydrolase [Virgibacillus necropolis]|nr:M20 family metallo-hydrolase [Virgibacillus necropolis]